MPEKDKPLARLKRKTTVENLWIYILRLLREKPMYAYEINKNIADRFDFEIGTATSYVVLYKLKNNGLVNTDWREEGRPRKYYTITSEGEKLLDKGIEYMKKLGDIIE